MDAKKALSILSLAAANYHGTRDDHRQLMEAEMVLLKLVNTQEQELSGEVLRSSPTREDTWDIKLGDK